MKLLRHSVVLACFGMSACLGAGEETSWTSASLAVAASPLEDVEPGAAVPDEACTNKLTGTETFRVAGADVLVAFRNGLPVCTDTLESIESELVEAGAPAAARNLRSQYEARSLGHSFGGALEGVSGDGRAAGDPNPQPAVAGDPNPQPAVTADPNPQPARTMGDPNPQPAVSGDPNPQPAAPVATPVAIAATTTSSATEP